MKSSQRILVSESELGKLPLDFVDLCYHLMNLNRYRANSTREQEEGLAATIAMPTYWHFLKQSQM